MSTQTTVADLVIPGRKPNEKFSKVVSHALNEKECQLWIQDAEEQGFQPASLLENKEKNPHRNNDRVLMFDQTKSEYLFKRLKPYLPSKWTYENKEWVLVGLNERLSILRYRTSEHYGRHVDVPYEDEKRGVRSFITCQLYLNEEFKGGETRFDQEVGYTDYHKRSHLDVVPKTGSVLLFEHELVHEGMPLLSGKKYTVRIDALYSKP